MWLGTSDKSRGVPPSIGFCETTSFDVKYSWTEEKTNNYYTFRGYQNTMMYFDADIEQWKLEIYSRPEVFATVNSTEYPFGTMQWHVYNDSCSEEEVSEEVVELNVNTCTSGEFNCEDGTCVDMNLRCDGDVDCPDKTGNTKKGKLFLSFPYFEENKTILSDEVNCMLFSLDDSYIKESAPKEQALVEAKEEEEEEDGESEERERVNVAVDIDILSILDMSEVDGFLSLQINLRLTW